MQFVRKHKTMIVLGIGALFILYGILDAIFKFNVSQQTVSNVGMLLMIVAFGLLFSGRKPKQNSSDETEMNSTIQDNTTQFETRDNEQDNNSDVDNTAQTETNDNEQENNSDIDNNNSDLN